MNYSTSERECLAVVSALTTLMPYILYEKFIVHTDHAALHWSLKVDDTSGRLMIWNLLLAEHDFEVRYKNGKENTQANVHSRLHKDGETVTDDNDDISTFSIDEHNDADDAFVDLLHGEDNADDSAEPEYANVKEIIVTMDEPSPPIRTSNQSPSNSSSRLSLHIISAPKYAAVLTRGKCSLCIRRNRHTFLHER